MFPTKLFALLENIIKTSKKKKNKTVVFDVPELAKPMKHLKLIDVFTKITQVRNWYTHDSFIMSFINSEDIFWSLICKSFQN